MGVVAPGEKKHGNGQLFDPFLCRTTKSIFLKIPPLDSSARWSDFFFSILYSLLQGTMFICLKNFFCIPLFYPKRVLYLFLLQTLYAFYNLS